MSAQMPAVRHDSQLQPSGSTPDIRKLFKMNLLGSWQEQPVRLANCQSSGAS